MAKFRVKKGASLPYNDGVSAQVYKEGAEVDLPLTVAADVANRWMLEPLDEQARFALMPQTATDPAILTAHMAAHERVQLLTNAVKDLEAKLADTKAALAQAEAEQKAVAEKMASGPASTPTGELIGGVPVRVIDHGTGDGVTAGVVHGEPTKLTPGDSGIVPQPTGRGVADQTSTRAANPDTGVPGVQG